MDSNKTNKYKFVYHDLYLKTRSSDIDSVEWSAWITDLIYKCLHNVRTFVLSIIRNYRVFFYVKLIIKKIPNWESFLQLSNGNDFTTARRTLIDIGRCVNVLFMSKRWTWFERDRSMENNPIRRDWSATIGRRLSTVSTRHRTPDFERRTLSASYVW